MSIIEIEMPNNCSKCPLEHLGMQWCTVARRSTSHHPTGKPMDRTVRPKWCPIHEKTQNEQRWIPCSERLPDPETIVLISQSYSWQKHEEGATVTLGRLHCAKDRGGYTYWEWQYYRPDFKHGTIMDNGIICPGGEYVDAWMPLPESYK